QAIAGVLFAEKGVAHAVDDTPHGGEVDRNLVRKAFLHRQSSANDRSRSAGCQGDVPMIPSQFTKQESCLKRKSVQCAARQCTCVKMRSQCASLAIPMPQRAPRANGCAVNATTLKMPTRKDDEKRRPR